MKDFYEKIVKLSNEVDERQEEIKEDKMSIIVGLADSKESTVETLCVSGYETGIYAMLNLLAEQLFDDEGFIEEAETTLN